jgi:hypothetical protein
MYSTKIISLPEARTKILMGTSLLSEFHLSAVLFCGGYCIHYTTVKPSDDDDVALKMRNLLFIYFSLSLHVGPVF